VAYNDAHRKNDFIFLSQHHFGGKMPRGRTTRLVLKQPKPNRKCWIRSWIRRRNIMVAHHALLNEFKEENPKSYRNFL
jgi:hypothetical protein